MTRAELKAQAKAQLKGKVWWLFLCTLIVSGISMAIGMIPVVGIIATYIVAPALAIGLTMVYLSVTYGEEVQINTLFDGFRGPIFGKSIGLYLLIVIYTLLWSLLFVIPGIIKAYSYSMSFYILAENPDMTVNEAITESKEIMNGHKMELFVLGLSFILWIFAIVFTFGLAAIYVEPYMQLTITNFYHNIKRQPVASASYDAPMVEDIIE